jgi:hypothetical protein
MALKSLYKQIVDEFTSTLVNDNTLDEKTSNKFRQLLRSKNVKRPDIVKVLEEEGEDEDSGD